MDQLRDALGVDTIDVNTGGGESGRGPRYPLGSMWRRACFCACSREAPSADSLAVVEVEMTATTSRWRRMSVLSLKAAPV